MNDRKNRPGVTPESTTGPGVQPEAQVQLGAPGRRHLAIVDQGVAVTQARDVDVSSVLQIGELAKITGKTVRAIHLYEDMGLLTPVERSKGRYRIFNGDSVERVRWIIKLQAVGFSLPEIRQIVAEQEEAPTARDAASRLRSVFQEKLDIVRGKLVELHRLERELVSSLHYLGACETACATEAPANSCPACERHVDQPHQPALVAGLHAN